MSPQEKATAKRSRPLWFENPHGGVFRTPPPKPYERRCSHGRMAECANDFCARLYREG